MIRIFFSGLGKALRDQKASGASSTTPEVWAKASAEALEILYKCKSPYPPIFHPSHKRQSLIQQTLELDRLREPSLTRSRLSSNHSHPRG
jgi:hypothetical protein